jgi:hypothetical protein
MSSRATLLADIDRMDADAWATYLAEDAVMRFGNADPVRGAPGLPRRARGLLRDDRRSQSRHCRNVGAGGSDDRRDDVTYARKDGRRVTVPVVTVYRTNDDDMIAAYRVFIDLEPVFAEG